MRHEFEKWYQEEVTGCNGEWLVKDDGGQYVERSTREAWIVWQQASNSEREACAKVCDDLVHALDGGGNQYRRPAHAEHCAAKIRARSNSN